MTEITSDSSFQIEYNGHEYRCDPILRGSSTLYRIHFPKSQLYVVKATSAQGQSFWTSIPEDFKLKHLVQQLGAIIEVASKNNK